MKEKELTKFMKEIRKGLETLSVSFVELLKVLEQNKLIELPDVDDDNEGGLSKDITDVQPIKNLPSYFG